MFPNGYGEGPIWGADNFVLGAAVVNWRQQYADLSEEAKAYLSAHENEIHTGADVERLVRMYEMKK